jgi:hypothetical protein
LPSPQKTKKGFLFVEEGPGMKSIVVGKTPRAQEITLAIPAFLGSDWW